MLLALGRPQRQGATGGGGFTAVFAVSLVWLLALARLADAAQWTVTSYYAVSITTYSYTYRNYQYTTTRVYTDSSLYSLKASATTLPASAAVSTVTLGDYDGDVETVRIYLPISAVPSSDLSVYGDDTDRSSRYVYTYYVQPMAYSAPSSCPTPFTVTSSRTLSLPSAVAAQVTPTSTTSTVRDYGDGTLYTTVKAYIDKTYWPTGSSLSRDFTYSYYVSNCRNPQASSTTSTSSRYRGGDVSGPGNSNGDLNSDSSMCGADGSGCVGGVPIWGIVLAAVLPSVFLFGFVESFLWFRRLMLGKSTMRFATISWILLCPPIIFLLRRVPSRLVEDQERLREQWTGMTAGSKFRLWAKLGLRHRYPFELLGEHDDWKPDGYLDESDLPATSATGAAYGTQPMVQRPRESLPPPVAGRSASGRQQQRRSQSQRMSTGMPTIHEQPRVPPQARLAGERSPSPVVSSVSDAAPVSEPTPPPMPPRRPDGHSEAGPSNSRPDGGSQA